jgi:DNA-binding NarL/FixJ family response regulator
VGVDRDPRPDPEAAAIVAATASRSAAPCLLPAEGWTNRRIAQELFISEKTTGVHVSRILAKLGVAGRREAAAIAHRLGSTSGDSSTPCVVRTRSCAL